MFSNFGELGNYSAGFYVCVCVYVYIYLYVLYFKSNVRHFQGQSCLFFLYLLSTLT